MLGPFQLHLMCCIPSIKPFPHCTFTLSGFDVWLDLHCSHYNFKAEDEQSMLDVEGYGEMQNDSQGCLEGGAQR